MNNTNMKHAAIHPFSKEEKKRLLSKIRKAGKNDCWPWLAYSNRKGYRCFRRRKPRMVVTATRAIWAITYGDPGNKMVCHTCDNPSCCNPKHLFLGTAADNAADMAKKGRASKHDRKGVKNGRAKLNEKDVEQIIRLCRQRMTNKEIGHYFGVTHSMISAIRLGKAWGLSQTTEKYASIRRVSVPASILTGSHNHP